MARSKALTAKQAEQLIATLEARFASNAERHKGVDWARVRSRVAANASALWSLGEMERTGGEPDVVAHDRKAGTFTFVDCSAQSPKDRRSLCFDRAALDARKEHKPRGSATEMAAEMGVALLTEAEYRALQDLGEFDTTTSSWIATPPAIRAQGGALFCDRRYDHDFVYHNGAESYYAARGFRASVRV